MQLDSKLCIFVNKWNMVCVCVRHLKITYKTQVKGGDDAWKQTRGKQLNKIAIWKIVYSI